jgi:MSHA biogenesis protein MshQ
VISAATSASTCVAHAITIRAVDTAGNTVTSYGGTVSLTTSTGRGGWANVSGSGALTETGTANDGEATYVFTSADAGQVVLSLSNESAEDLAITVRDNTTATITGTSGIVSFRDNAFVITPTDVLANTVVAGRPHGMQIALWRRDTSLATPNCAIATSYTGARNLKAWYTVDPNHPAGATAPSITSTLGTAVPGANNLALTFAAGVATFNLGTTDVGKYVLNVRDDSRTFAGAVNIDGSSPTLTVRPFAIAVTNAVRGGVANPEGTATTGGKFAAAGDTFAATIAAYLWSAADDANNDGTPDTSANVTDNSLVPRFAWPVALSASSTSGLFTPVGGTLGVLGGTTTVAGGSFVSGAAVPTDLTYSEVGSIGLLATVTGYLGTSGVDLAGVYRNAGTGVAARIGRFHPASFALSGATVTPSCGTGNQTYMNEPALGVAFTLQARSAAGAVTTNYRDGVYTVGAVILHAENADAGTNLSARVTGLPATVWTLGAYSLTATGATFTRSASPDGPFDSLVLGVSVTDPDGALVSTPDMNAATAGACGTGCNARALNGSTPTRVRFGRLKIGNALGAPQLDLPVPLTTQYWNGVAFVTNAQDSCTRFTNTQFAFGTYRAPLAACATSGAPAGANGIVVTSGRGALRLSKPNVRGSVDLTANLGPTASGTTCSAGAAATATAASRPWLQGNWGASTWDRDPAGRAVFGVPRASADVIYQRENY